MMILLIECVCCGIGLLDVKCPLSYKDIKPQELALTVTGEALIYGFKIKTHKYYAPGADARIFPREARKLLIPSKY